MRITLALILFTLPAGCNPNQGIQTRTAQEIAKVQSGVQDSVADPFAPILFGHAHNDRVVNNLKELSLTGDLAPFTNPQILKFDQIRKIDLNCTQNTDEFLAILPKLPNLAELYILETDATGNGVTSTSKCKNLTEIGITSRADAISMDSVNRLAQIPTLQQISLEISTKPNDLSQLRAELPNCEIFETTYRN